MGINDFGGPTDTLATPSLSEWAGSVAAHLTAGSTWVSYLPTLTGFTSADVQARYIRQGELVVVSATFAMPAVSAPASFSLPVAALYETMGASLNRAGGNDYLGSFRAAGASCLIYAWTSSAAYAGRAQVTSGVPAAWGTAGDKIIGSIVYVAAALP